MMLSEKIDTVVNRVITRNTRNAPSTAKPPISTGMHAATRLPNTTSRASTRIGMPISSARAMSVGTRLLIARSTARWPPIMVLRSVVRSACPILLALPSEVFDTSRTAM